MTEANQPGANPEANQPAAGGRRIVLCATQRCGSTMICEDMWNTGVLGKPEEYFIPWDPAKPGVPWAEAWQNMQRRHSTENGTFAVKIMANQLPPVDQCFAKFRPAPAQPAGLFDHFRDEFRDAAWVYLVREDVCEQAISQIISRQTGVSHATAQADQEHFAGKLMKGYRADYNERVKFNLPALKRRMNAILRENMVWRRFFATHGIKPLVLRYEEVVQDFPGYLGRLASHAGVELASLPEPRKLVKLANQKNSEWYRELTDALIGELAEV